MTGVPLYTSRSTDRLLALIQRFRRTAPPDPSTVRLLIRTCQKQNAWWRRKRKLDRLRSSYRRRKK